MAGSLHQSRRRDYLVRRVKIDRIIRQDLLAVRLQTSH